MKKNLHFKQSQFHYRSNPKKIKQKIKSVRLVTTSVRVGVVVKTNDEIYVIRAIK